MLQRICQYFLICTMSAQVWAITVEPGAKEVAATPDTTLADFLKKVEDLGYVKTSITCGSLGKLVQPKYKQGLTLGDLGLSPQGKCTAILAAKAPPSAIARQSSKENADLNAPLKSELLSLAFSDRDSPSTLSTILAKVKNGQKTYELLQSAKTEAADGRKGILYLAARKGNLKLIQAIQNTIPKADFMTLVLEKTDQKQSVLHAAARATKNAETVIRHIIALAPNLVSAENSAGCTPYEVALMFHQADDARLAALLNLQAASDAYKKHAKSIRPSCKNIEKGGM